MRALALVLLFSPLFASAQISPEAVSAPEAKPWRIAASGGLHSQFGSALGFSADRAVLGPLAAGARLTVLEGGGLDDGGNLNGGTLDAFLALQTGGRWVRARAFAAAGLGYVDYDAGGLVLDYENDISRDSGSFEGVQGYGIIGLGVDLHVTRGVAIGSEYRIHPSDVRANVSTLDIGLRLRF